MVGPQRDTCIFLRCLDSEEIQATAAQFLPVKCQQTMFLPRNISGGLQEESRRRDSPRLRGLSVRCGSILLEGRQEASYHFLWETGPWDKMSPPTNLPLFPHPSLLSFRGISETQLVELIQEPCQLWSLSPTEGTLAAFLFHAE